MANDTKIAAVIGLSAAVGLAAWYFLRKKKEEGTEDEEERSPEDSGVTYDRAGSIRVRGGDRGYGVTAVSYDRNRQPKHPSSGSIGYRYGETVSYTEPIFFGAQSYRGTRCVPTKDLPYSDQGEELYLYGQARGHGPDNPGDAQWFNRQYLDHQRNRPVNAWTTNGAALTAKSWSCNISNTQGFNNVKCFNARNRQNMFNLGADAGGLGFMPFFPEYTQRFLEDEGAAVPFIGYGNSSTGTQTGGRTYPDLTHRASKSGGGFVDEDGMVWIQGDNSLNFRYIHDENPNVVYYYAMKGAGGIRTAMNRLSHRRVANEDLRPRWRDLTTNETLQFRRMSSENYAKIDPWSIPNSPWQIMDRMEAKQFTVYDSDGEGLEYSIDYRARRGGNDIQRLVALGAPSGANATAANIPYISWAGQGLLNNYIWPTPNYGLIDPWRNPTNSQANSMPYDFAMPIWMHVWSDMEYDDKIVFIGDVTNTPTTVRWAGVPGGAAGLAGGI